MAGNEKEAAKYLIANKGILNLDHLGIITSVGAPSDSPGEYIEMNSDADVDNLLSTEEAGKKADIYVNGHGVSLKQMGASFLFNRLQRSNLVKLFSFLAFSDPAMTLSKIDDEIEKFHRGITDGRNINWTNCFSRQEFEKLLEYLMMEGSPNVGKTQHVATLLLEYRNSGHGQHEIAVYTFEEYFARYSEKIVIALRRQWIGQSSNSENKRAQGLAKKQDNLPWVFTDIVGEPRTGWQRGFPEADKRTVYFLMIEKLA